ncbi:MAG: c-type cytochrome [Bacteroidia bacterium]
MFNIIKYTHLISVNLFLLIYLIKTILLLGNKEEALARFTKGMKVFEMVISALFLLSGIYLLMNVGAVSTLIIIKVVIVFASIPLAIIGFKKRNKALAVISILMIIAAYGLAEINKKHVAQPTNTSSNNSSANAGQDIFSQNCVSCHGEDGKAGLSGAADLSTSTLSLQAKIDIIKNGKNGTMPSYSALNDEQIKAVAEYTETLKK